MSGVNPRLQALLDEILAAALERRTKRGKDTVNDFYAEMAGHERMDTWRTRLAEALAAASVTLADIEYAAIYDSFTITLAILLEEIGLAPRGGAGKLAGEGYFSNDGELALNTHGGLLSYGHCGVGGAMAHLVETQLQLTGRADERQAGTPRLALLHGDGGVLSSHVSMVLEAA